MKSNREKQRISIVIIGASHRDPAPIALLNAHLSRLTEQTPCKMVVCTELPCDQSLSDKQKLEKFNHKLIKNLLKIPPIQQLMQRDKSHALPYFHAKKLPVVADIIKPILTILVNQPITNAIARRQAKQLIEHLALKQTVSQNKLLQTRNIPYQGLSRPTHLHTKFNAQMAEQDSNRFFFQQEPRRINHMIDSLFNKAIPKLKGDSGIVFCQVGFLHAQRLEAHLLHRISLFETSDTSIHVKSVCCYSPYTTDSLSPFLEIINSMAEYDPSHIQALYSKCQTQLIQLSEKHEEHGFSSILFDLLLQTALQFVSEPKIYRTLKVDVGESIALLQQLKIKTIKAKQGFAIKLHPSQLTPEACKILDIQRLLIKVNGSSKTINHYKKFCTFEETVFEGTYLVTFPSQLLNETLKLGKVINIQKEIAAEINALPTEPYIPSAKKPSRCCPSNCVLM